MSVRFPSLHFPSPTPIRGRSCFVHVKQEGILEVLRATGIQHFLVPLPVLSDKIFHLLNHAVQAHVCARKVLQNAQGDFKHLQGTDKVPEPIILAGLVLWVLMFWAACIATTTKAIIYPADLEGVPPTWAYLHTHTHSHTYTDTHTHTHTHTQCCMDLCIQPQSLSHLLRFLLSKPILVQRLILTPRLTDGFTREGSGLGVCT